MKLSFSVIGLIVAGYLLGRYFPAPAKALGLA